MNPGEIPKKGGTAFRGERPQSRPPKPSRLDAIAGAAALAAALAGGGAGVAGLRHMSRHESGRPAATARDTPSKPDASQESTLREIPAFVRERLPSIGQTIFEDVLARYPLPEGRPSSHHGDGAREATPPRSITSLYNQSLYAHLGEAQDDLTASINGASVETGMDIMADGDEPSMSGLDRWLEDANVRSAVRDETILAARRALKDARNARPLNSRTIDLIEHMLMNAPPPAPAERQ